MQAINTCPDNFLWEKDKSSLICVAPGLYQISFGFYAKKQPQISIFLNGETLMVANGKGNNDFNKENAVSNPTKHTAGNVTGLTHNDFIALPARARIALIYSGDSFGEGFISLRKL